MFNIRSKNGKRDEPLHKLKYSDCHGITETNLGTASLIFSLVQMHNPSNIVIIGSGAGVIPRILREAQIASGNSEGKTFLIDLGETMGAIPQEIHNDKSLFRTMYPEIEVQKGYSVPNGIEYLNQKNINTIDILWIDGDHSFEGSFLDFEKYSALVSKEGLIFLHDTYPFGYVENPSPSKELVPSWCGVHHTIEEIRKKPEWEVFNFIATPKHKFGCGLAIVKKRLV